MTHFLKISQIFSKKITFLVLLLQSAPVEGLSDIHESRGNIILSKDSGARWTYRPLSRHLPDLAWGVGYGGQWDAHLPPRLPPSSRPKLVYFVFVFCILFLYLYFVFVFCTAAAFPASPCKGSMSGGTKQLEANKSR